MESGRGPTRGMASLMRGPLVLVKLGWAGACLLPRGGPLVVVIGLLLALAAARGAFASNPPPPGTVQAWQDAHGHTWVETEHYLLDVSHGSVCLIRLGQEPKDWAYQNEGQIVHGGGQTGDYQWSAYLGTGGGNEPPGGYAGGEYFQTLATIAVPSGPVAEVEFSAALWAPALPDVTFPVLTRLTFYGDRPIIKLQYWVENVLADPYPPGLDYVFTLVPGGDKENDFYHWSGQDGEDAFPYGDWVGSIAADQIAVTEGWDGYGYAFLTDYDKAARQGLAYIARLDRTADFVTDHNYGRMSICDTTHHYNFCHIVLTLDSTQAGTLYLYFYEPDPLIPWQPVEDLIREYIAPHEFSVAALEPSPTSVPWGGVTSLSARYSDSGGHGVASWSWSDGGAGGSFSPSADVQNPTYTAPENAGEPGMMVTLTVHATCDGPEPLSDTHTARLTVHRIGVFPDVPEDHWACSAIEACCSAGIVGGYDDGLYHPDWTLSRDQMAVFISRSICTPTGEAGLVDYEPPDTASFTDVPTDYWAYKYIEYAAEHNIVAGYGDGTYQPQVVLDRGQMAVFIARAIAGDDESVPDPTGDPSFPDVPADFWSYRHIEYIAAEEVAGGYYDGLYHPENLVSRDQMAVFICRAFNLL